MNFTENHPSGSPDSFPYSRPAPTLLVENQDLWVAMYTLSSVLRFALHANMCPKFEPPTEESLKASRKSGVVEIDINELIDAAKRGRE